MTLEGLPSARELIMIARPEAELRVSREGIASTAGADVASLEDLLRSAGASLQPLFGTMEADVPDLSMYYRVEAPDERLDELAEQLRSLDVVEAAYVKPPAVPGSLQPSTIVPQGYLDPSPGGIEVGCAWALRGGGGDDVRIIDIEGAWRFSHEDLLQNQGGIVGGTPHPALAPWRDHGTAVLGVLGGDRNAFGITGICPEANVQAISIFSPAPMGGLSENSAAAILNATNRLRAGDIILIELQRPGGPNLRRIPLEWWPDDFAAIQSATSAGRIVVEIAGNDGEDLDDASYNTPQAYYPAGWTNPFNRANRDSGAIVVGTGAPPPGTHGRNHGPDRSRLAFSNFGALVDAQGWGEEITTTGYGDVHPGGTVTGTNEDEWYTDIFNGTSGATVIVTGALACVQGALRARGSTPLDPPRARQLLRDTGSAQQDAPGTPPRPITRRIGNRPNLRQMLFRVIPSPLIHELFLNPVGTQWQHTDLTAMVSGAPPAIGGPAGYAWNGQHVVYRGNDNNIHELFLQLGGSQWQHTDLTVAASAPAPLGDPAGYGWGNGGGGQHVVYRGEVC